MKKILGLCLAFWLCFVGAQKVLVVKGGSGTGGFITNGEDFQLSDVNDCSEGGAGYGQLSNVLRANGITVDQVEEGPISNPTPADLSNITLYDLIFFGSNNFQNYPTEVIDSVENYVKNGGKLLFISDAQWGRNWGLPPASDQLFLNRFGWIMNQDAGQGPISLTRANGDYLVPDHPILENVNTFGGEGTSFITIQPFAGVTTSIIVRAIGNRRQNTGPNQGPLVAVDSNDASIAVASVGNGTVVGFLDRNTFFNKGGIGFSIFQDDNLQLAKNLFGFLLEKNITNFEPCPASSPVSIPSFVLLGLALLVFAF